MEFHVKKSQFSEKSRFKESKCAKLRLYCIMMFVYFHVRIQH